MALQGALDRVEEDAIAGWAWDNEEPHRRLEIEIVVNGNVIASVRADQFRQDLEVAGIGDGAHAFNFAPVSPLYLREQPVTVTVSGTDFCLPRSQGPAGTFRRDQITRFIDRHQAGIEIGPYFNPLAPKRLGYNVLVFDVFDAETLRRHASSDPNIPTDAIGNIEEVDIIGTANQIAEHVDKKFPFRKFDYIISSHNFEHLPDPIRFLQGSEKVLRADGFLSMAIPDRRTCFDYFRPHSTLADLLAAYFTHRDRPTALQIFQQNSLHSRYITETQQLVGFSLTQDPSRVRPLETLEEAFISYQRLNEEPNNIYIDTHCWTFTPASFKLMMLELRFLGLIHLQAVDIAGPSGNEFYVHLKNSSPDEAGVGKKEAFYELRRKLLHQINDEAGENSMRTFAERRRFEEERARLERRIAELEHRLRQREG